MDADCEINERLFEQIVREMVIIEYMLYIRDRFSYSSVSLHYRALCLIKRTVNVD